MRASRLSAAAIALLAAACVTVTPAARSDAPINACSTDQDCQGFAPGRTAPACLGGICASTEIGSWTAVVTLSQDAAYAAGATIVVPFSTLEMSVGSCQGGSTTCPPGMLCAPLPGPVTGSGELIVQPAGASSTQANWNLGNPQQNRVLPVQATFRPQSQRASTFVDSTLVGLPLGPIEAQDLIDTSPSAPPGPGNGPSLLFSFSLPQLLYERTLMPVAPFDQAFPPDIQLVDLTMGQSPDENVIFGCKAPPATCAPFDALPGAMGSSYPTFDLSRADGQALDGWTAYLRDQTSRRRISNLVPLSGTTAKGVTLLTSHHPKSLLALDNAALVMQPPSGSGLPTAILAAVAGSLGQTESYPLQPMPISVSGTVNSRSGAPVAADVVFDSLSLCRDYVSSMGQQTVELDPSQDLAFTTTVSAANGSYSATLPLGVYRATVRPRDTSAQVTVIPDFTNVALSGQQCGAAAQPGPIVVDVQRTVQGVAAVADGRLLADATIEAFPTECSDNTTAPGCLPRQGNTTTDDKGSFTMALDPGGYLLRIRPAEGSAFPWVVTPLTVGPDPVTNVTGLPPVLAPFDASLVLLDPVACNPIVEAVVRMYETPATGNAFEIGEALTDSTGHYAMYLEPPAQ